MSNFSKNINLSNRVYTLLIVLFLSLGIAIAQPNATSLSCGVSSAQTLTSGGFSGSNPTAATGSCGQCCYSGSDLDGDGDQDVSFSVENSKWFEYCNPSGTTAITIDFIVSETNNNCNLQGAVFVGGTNPNGATDALDVDCSNQEFSEFGSNVGGAANGFSFTGVTIPAGGCAYIMVDGYGGATCGAFTINTVCPPSCTVPTTMTAGLDISICEGLSGALNSTVSGGLTSGSGLVYSWAPSTGLSCTTCADPTANPTSTTTYTLTACNGGTGFCCVTDQVIVNVTPSFVANAGADITSCAPSTITLGGSGGSPTGPAGSTYTWTVSGINNTGIAISAGANTANPTVTINTGATGFETYLVTVVNGACTRTDLVTVTVGTLLVSAGLDQSVCVGSTVSIGGLPTAPAGSTYTWTCSGTACANLSLSSSTVANPVVTANALATGTATYTVSATLSGCTNTDVVVVTVNPLPTTPTATPSASPVCAGQSVTLTAAGGSGSGTYSWWTAATNGTNLGSANTLVITPTATTTYYVQSTDATTGCISVRGFVTVTVNSTPVASAGADATLCVGETHTLAGSVANPGACAPLQTWSLISGTGTFSPDANTLNATFTPTSSGTIQIRLTPCTPGGCTAVTDDIILTVAASPVVTVSSTSSTICPGLINDLNGVVSGGTVFSPTITNQSFSSASGPFPFLDNDPNGVVVPISVSGVSNPSLGTTIISGVTVNVDHNRVGQVEVYLCPPGVSATTPYTGCLLMFNNSGGNSDDLVNTVFTDASATDIAAGTPPYTGSFNLDGAATLAGLSGSPTNGTWNLVVLDNNGANPATTGSAGQWSVNFQTPTPVPPYTYTWTPSTGLSVTNDVSTSLFTSGFTPPTSVTHTLTVTDANGCSASGSVTTNIIVAPTSNAGSNQIVCGTTGSLAGNALVAGQTGLWTVVSGTGTFSAGTSNITNVTGLSTGINVFDWAVTNSCGTVNSQVTLTSDPIPVVTNTITTTSGCGTATALLNLTSNVTGTTFAWTAVNTGGTVTGFTATGSGNINQTLLNAVTTAGSVVYTITPTADGCAGTAVTYTVIVNPTANISGTLSACIGATSQLTGDGTAAGASPWTSSDPSIATVSNTGLVSGVTSGTVTITYTNSSGCSDNETFTVNANPTVSGTLSACVGATSQLTGSATANASTPWVSSNTGVATVNSTGLVTAVSGGTSTITYMNTNGCTTTATFTVNANPTVSGTLSACVGATSQLTGSATANASTPWVSSNTGVATVNSTGLVTAVSAGTITITYMNTNGCTTTATFTVNANPTVSGTLSACVNGTSQLTGSAPANASTPWVSSNIGVATVNSTGLVTAVSAGTITITYMNTNGCTTTATFTVNANPTIIVSGTNSFCNGGNTVLSAVGATTFDWSPAGSLSSSSGSSVTATPTSSTNYTITGTDGNSCSASTTYSVTVNDNPTSINYTPVDAGCGLSDGSVLITGTVGGTATYQYNFNNLGLSSTVSYTGLAANSYPLLVSDANGCTFSTFVNINNAGGPTSVATTLVADSCGRNTGEILIGVVTGGGGTNTYSIDGSAFTGTLNYTTLSSGLHSIEVRDQNNCTFSTSVNIPSLIGPTGFSTNDIDETCGSTNGSIEVTTVNGGTSAYTYSINGGAFGAGTTFSGLANGTYTITVKDVNTCEFTNQISITNIAGPTAVASSIIDATCGASNGSITLGLVTGGVGADEFNIDGGSFGAANSFNGLVAATYTIGVRDDNGCIYTTQITVGNSGGPSAITTTIVSATCGLSNGSITVDNVTGGVGTYQYSLDGVNYSSFNTITNLTATSYTIYVQDGNLCGYSEPFIIAQASGPTDIDSVVVNATCDAANGSVDITSVNGGVVAYQYNFNNLGLSATTLYTGLIAGNYPLLVVDGNNCNYNTTVTIGGTPSITALTSSVVNEACGQLNGSIDITLVTGGTGAYQYSINAGTLGASSSFTGLAVGSYTIGIEDAAGCTYSEIIAVGGTGGPTAVASTIVDAGCSVATGSITIDNVTGGSPSYSYGINAGAVGASNSFTGLSANIYTIEVVDANSCSYTTTLTIGKVGGPTSATTSQVNTTCGSVNGAITVDAVTGGASPYQYSINGGGFGPGNNFVSLSASSTHTISIVDANNCPLTLPVITLTDAAGPSAATTSSVDAACGNSNGSITVDAVTGGTAPYNYSINGGAFSTTNTFTGLSAATQYTISITDGNNCPLSLAPIVLNTIAGPSAASTTEVNASCGSSNGSITVDLVTGGTSPYQYSINGGAFSAANTFSGLAGSASYTVSIMDANNCPLNLNPIALNTSAGPSAATTSQVNTTCGNSNGSITVDPTSVVGGVAPYTYGIDGGTIGVSNVFTNLSAASSHAIIVSDVNGCLVVLPSITLTDVAGPTAIASTVVDVTCGSSNGSFTVDAIAGGTAPYQYDLNGLGLGATTTLTGLSMGSYPVTVQDANGCNFSTSVLVAGTGALVADFVATPLSIIIPVTVDFNNNSTLGAIYSWTFGNGTSATTYDAQQQYTTAGVYTVTLVVSNGVDPLCNDTASSIITVIGEPTVVVPNIFSPNGDGINDVLTIQSSGFKELDMIIFNRWGSLIASYNAIGGNWSGDNSAEGTYYYILKGKRIDDKEFESHGAIMLVK